MCRHTFFSKKAFTSGTTNTPVQIIRDINSIAAEQYFLNRYYKWKDYYKVVFRGGKLFEVNSEEKRMYKKIPFINEIHVNNYSITEEGLKDLTKKLSEIKRKICLYSGPSSAVLLAQYCLQHDISLNIRLIATASEVLYPHHKNLLNQAFNCPIRDFYGQAERVAALCLCRSDNYHPVADYSHIEFIPVKNGLYEIVGTTAHNFAMPLIRYRTGDLVELDESPCPCGYKGISVKAIHGRAGNIVTLHDRQLPGTILTLPLRVSPSINECQIVIKNNHKVIYKIVKLPSYSSLDEQNLSDEIAKIIPGVNFSLEYVNEIKRTKSGKFNFIVFEN
jgi:phenylacetate-CoA ligase